MKYSWHTVLVLFLVMITIFSCSHFSNVKKTSGKGSHFNVAWQKNLDPAYETGNLPISFHSPNFKDGIVFMGSPDGAMRAYNAANGKTIWEAKEKRAISNQATFSDRFVYYGTIQGLMVVRDYLTGELVYSIDLGSSIEAPVTIEKGIAFAHLRDHHLVALDASTGKILWNYKRTVAQGTTIQEAAPPVLYMGKLIVGFADGHIVAFTPEEGAILWEQNLAEDSKFVDVNMRPLFKDNLMFVGSQGGPLSIVNVKNGDVLKRFPFRSLRAPVLLDDNNFLVGTEEGHVILMDKNGSTLIDRNLNSPIFGINLWMGNLVAATRDGKLYLLDAGTLETKEIFSFGHYYSLVFGDLVVDGDKLALFSSRNRLYVFKTI